MQPGKLPLNLLSRLLDEIDVRDPRVVLGARAGEDAALIDFGDRYLVAKTDPITFATDLIGWYMVQINTNDIAVMGGTPRWLMTTLLLPDTTSESEVESIFKQVREACDALNVALIGGHTEITYDLPRPIAVGAMLGEVPKERAVLTSGARPGDSIVLTKAIAVEGTSILAREAADDLLERGLTQGAIDRAKDFLSAPASASFRKRRLRAMWWTFTPCTIRPKGVSPAALSRWRPRPTSDCLSIWRPFRFSRNVERYATRLVLIH